jgi:putative spermidine/putrescine transport system permease protein
VIGGQGRHLGAVLFGAFGWLALLYLALPLIVIIGVSFSTTAFLSFPPVGVTLKWYVQFLRDPSYLDAIWTSTSLACLATGLSLALGVPAALVLERVRFAGQKALTVFFLSPLVLPPIVMGAAILQYASALGFARSYSALLVGHTAIVIPYIVRTTLASLSGISPALEEAARDLGDTGFGAFFRITLPIIKPGIIAGSLFAAIISWINVELNMFNTTASLMTIPVKLFNYIQYSVDPMIAAVSAATIYVAVLVVIAIDLTVGIDRIAVASG